MKSFKIAAFVLGGLAALLFAAAAFILATFDANKWKGEIAQLIQEKKSRSLKIEGDLSLSLFPGIGVELGKATLSEYKSGQVFASVDKARISLRLMPLLSKQVVVDTVELEGVKARLVRFKDGRLNIDDLLARDEKEPPVRFDIAGVKLAGGELDWRDEKAGRQMVFSDLHLAIGRLANAAADRFELSAKLAGGQPRLAAQLAASGQYHYDLDRKSYGGSGIALHLAGDIAGLKSLDLALDAATLQPGGRNGISVDRLALAAKGGEGGEAFEARINLSGIAGSSQAFEAGKLTFQLEVSQGETAIKASLASALSANLEKQTVELPAFGGELIVATPQLPMKSLRLPLAGRLRADIDGQAAALDASTQFDESRIEARVKVSRFSPPTLGFDLDIDRLDVDKYLPPKGAAAGGRARKKPLDFPALKGLNASGVVRIGQLQVANIKAGNVRLEVKAAGGRLDVVP